MMEYNCFLGRNCTMSTAIGGIWLTIHNNSFIIAAMRLQQQY